MADSKKESATRKSEEEFKYLIIVISSLIFYQIPSTDNITDYKLKGTNHYEASIILFSVTEFLYK